MPPVNYKDLGSVDLKRDSLVQYTRNRIDAAGALCVGTIAAHPVVASYSDNLVRGTSAGGFESGNWLNIAAAPIPFPPLRNAYLMLLDGAQAQWYAFAAPNALPAPPADTKAGAYVAATPGNNWHVKATFNGGTRTVNETPGSILLFASMTFANPSPNENQVTCYAGSCTWISGTLGVNAQFQFRLFRIVNGVFTQVGGTFTSAPNAFGVGSTWELYLVCNNAPSPPNSALFPSTVFGFVNGVQRIIAPASFSVPAGVPGIGNIGSDNTPGCTFNVVNWSADQLSD